MYARMITLVELRTQEGCSNNYVHATVFFFYITNEDTHLCYLWHLACVYACMFSGVSVCACVRACVCMCILN